jgi:tetratricopeptide (TPR) repeat protein
MNGATLSDFDEMTFEELWAEMESAEDLNRGHILIELSRRKCQADEDGLSLVYASEAADVFRRIDDRRGLGVSLVLMGNAHHVIGEYTQAIECYKEAREPSTATAPDSDLAVLEENLANSLLADDQLEDAIKSYEAAEALYLAADMQYVALRCSLEIGNIHFQLGRDYEALDAYLRMREQSIGSPDISKVRKAESRLADAYVSLGEFDHAVVHAREALNLSKTCPCPLCINSAHVHLGEALRLTGDTSTAAEYVQKAFDEYHKEGNPGGQARCLLELGNLSIETEPEKSRDYFEQARSIFGGLDWELDRDKAIVGLAHLDANAGDLLSATDALEGIVNRATAAMKIGFANDVRLALAKYLLANGEPSRAIHFIDAMTDVGRITQSRTLNQLMLKAEAFAELRKWDEAMAAAESGLDMIIPGVTGAIEGVFHHVKGECLRHKDPVVAEREYAKAISFYVAGGQLERAELLAKEHFDEPAKLLHDIEIHESVRNKS